MPASTLAGAGARPAVVPALEVLRSGRLDAPCHPARCPGRGARGRRELVSDTGKRLHVRRPLTLDLVESLAPA